MKRKNNESKCDFIEFKNNRSNYKYKEYGKRWSNSINRLIKKFPSICQFCGDDLNNFVLLLRKGVYPHEYIDSWEKFDETSLTHEKAFYSELNLEDTSDQDYNRTQNVWDVIEIRNLGYYHDYHDFLISEPNYQKIKIFLENVLAIEMKKTKVKMSNPVYLGMSALDISKTLIYEFWYGYIKPKYNDNPKLFYRDTDSFVVNIFSKDFFQDIKTMLKDGLIHLTMMEMIKYRFK